MKNKTQKSRKHEQENCQIQTFFCQKNFTTKACHVYHPWKWNITKSNQHYQGQWSPVLFVPRTKKIVGMNMKKILIKKTTKKWFSVNGRFILQFFFFACLLLFLSTKKGNLASFCVLKLIWRKTIRSVKKVEQISDIMEEQKYHSKKHHFLCVKKIK